ncbi:uncharacterized protein LOC143452399 [Clavelina lepadiformis]|uniref:uncharacterized protein LOC143452399 n=1 Tax=Clavelina lepadiformis TaxID=159417 RepID=UPI00404130CC
MSFNDTLLNGTDAMSARTPINWIGPMMISVVLILATIWIILSLVIYGRRHKKWTGTFTNDSDKLTGGIIYTATLVCAVIVLLRCLVNQVLFNVGYGENEDELCEAICDLSYIMYCIALFFVYVFNWLRQRLFYANQMLNTTFSKPLKVFSLTSILFIFCAGLGVLITSAYPQNYRSTPDGCRHQINDVSDDNITWAVCGSVVFLGQLIMFCLFIYPFWRKTRYRKLFFSCSLGSKKSDDLSVSELSKCQGDLTDTGEMPRASKCSKAEAEIRKENRAQEIGKNCRSKIVLVTMRRTVLFFTLGVVTDAILFALSPTVLFDLKWRIIVYDVKAFLNLGFVISSFISFRKIILAPLRCLLHKREVVCVVKRQK